LDARQQRLAGAREIQRLPNVSIPAADGTTLAARMWLPAGVTDRPVPAVLESHPYRKGDGMAVRDERLGRWLAAAGFAFVRLDIRGSGDSEGIIEDEYLPLEQQDNAHVIGWLSNQAWCSGRVAMIGISWSGFAALQTAALAPAALSGIVALHSTDDRYSDDVHYNGGCVLGLDMLQWATSMRAYLAQPPDPLVAGDQWRALWLDRLERTPAFIEPWLSHQRRDDYWRQGSVCEDYAAIRCPVFAIGGWMDGYRDAVLRLVEHLPGQARGLIGPWGHTWPDKGIPGPAIDFMPELARFLRFALEGEANGWDQEPPLVYWMQDAVPPAATYAVRPGRWLAEPSWPSPSVETLALSLAHNGVLAATIDGQHGAEVPSGSSIRGLQATGLAAGVWCGDSTPGDSPADQRFEDGASLCFDSAPIAEPLELLGHARAVLELSTDRPRALVVARLCDVASDGASTLISRGVMNLAHRNGHDSVSAVVPGERMSVAILMQSTSYSIPPGHRLRLAISPTYWPWAWPSPDAVTLTVHPGGDSRLELPVRLAAETEPAAWTPFADPPELEEASNGFSEDLSGAPGGRRVVTDVATGRVELEFDWTGDTRTRLLGPPATELFEHNVTRYSIVEGDPLSAAVDCDVEVGLERDDWRIRVEVSAEMRCDLESFSVRTRLRAFEDDVPVFEDDRSSMFPRDGA
jgi:putative CocE/NonD family hydrolase